MPAIKVGVREFRERLAHFLESDAPVAITRRGETIGVFVPTPRGRVQTAGVDELRAAADGLTQALREVDEEEFVAEFSRLRKAGRARIK